MKVIVTGSFDPITVGHIDVIKQISDKYDDYVPSELLRRAYALDRMSPDEVMRYFVEENKGKGE